MYLGVASSPLKSCTKANVVLDIIKNTNIRDSVDFCRLRIFSSLVIESISAPVRQPATEIHYINAKGLMSACVSTEPISIKPD